MEIQENIPLGPKTTMRIGGTAKYFAELNSKEDCEEVYQFAKDKKISVVILGGGSNTIFADGIIDALVVRIKSDEVQIDGARVTVQSGKNLPMLINELATHGLDLSPLTGIPGSIGGAVTGNAGQGPKGIWINSYIESVTIFYDGKWKVLDVDECNFEYRESIFKKMDSTPIIWEIKMNIPSNDPQIIKNNIEDLFQKRIETQPHTKTSGSCFKAAGETPAWKLIDEAELRGKKIGEMYISEKHANFLINENNGNYKDAMSLVETIRKSVKEPLEVEIRFIKNDGTVEFS